MLDSDPVADNKVTITDGTVNGDIYGGFIGVFGSSSDAGAINGSGNATHNVVTIDGGAVNGSAFGGSSPGSTTTAISSPATP